MPFSEHDCVELARDASEYGLREGDIGTIVHVYRDDAGYEVEFITNSGQTTAIATVAPDDIRTITPRPKHDAGTMSPELEGLLRDRLKEQIRLEQSGDVEALCEIILPAYRARPGSLERSFQTFEEFVKRVQSAEMVSYFVESWLPCAPRFGGAPIAVVRSSVRYNGGEQPTEFRAIWVYTDGMWFNTAVGKFWPTIA